MSATRTPACSRWRPAISADYQPGRPYGRYFSSPELMFPALLRDDSLAAKDYVFALRDGVHDKAWPLADFEGGRILHDWAGDLELVLIGDAATRSVRAYESKGRTFAAKPDRPLELTAAGESWRITEEALVGPGGERLERLPGHIAYWFAWSGFTEE